MKTVSFLMVLLVALNIAAQTKTNKKQPVVKNRPGSQLSTDVKFDGTLVGGKIQAPFESLTVVENEKDIDDLIGVRKNFDDRSKKAKGLR